MSTDSHRCSFSSFLPMSCRERAEAFARRLNTRLRSLGTQDGSSADENSWLAANESPVAVSQPKHSDSGLYFDFTLLDSSISPEDETPAESELAKLITNNEDNLKVNHVGGGDQSKKSNGVSISSDSDSDGQYFDPEDDPKINVNGELEECDKENEFACANSAALCDNFSTALEESPTTSSLTFNEEESTLSLQDYPSLEFISCSQESSLLENNNTKGFDVVDCCKSLNSDSNLSEISKDYESIDSEKFEQFTCDDGIASVENDYRINGCLDQIDEVNQSNGVPDWFLKYVETSCTSECLNNENEHSTPLIENDVDFNETKEERSLIDQVVVKVETVDDETEDEVIPRVRRCSSLKTGKTPPGTPGRKKIVRFADVLGLDLADVRTYLDEIPKVPNSAYNDLLEADFNSSPSDISNSAYVNQKNLSNTIDRVLVPLFEQPGGQVNFIDKVRENQVCLENAVVEDPVALSVKGTVRVRNLDFNKSVHIRYSLDSWKSYSDLQGAYVANSCDGFSDKFAFLLYANTITVGQRLEMAVRFQCKGCQYWDNNKGNNYCFQCLPVRNQMPYSPIMVSDENWGAFYYREEIPDDDDRYQHKSTAIQEYITESLEKHKRRPMTVQKNPDVLTVVMILIFSVIFLYIQRAIYFA